MANSALLLIAVLLFPVSGSLEPALRPDEVRLKDGRVLVGRTKKGKDVWEIETRDGTVRVSSSDVEQWRSEDDLRRSLRELEQSSEDTPFSHLELARQAFAWDLDAELWRHLDRTVQLPPGGATQTLRHRIDGFLAALEPEVLPRKFRSADVATRVHEFLGALPRKARPGIAAAVRELLFREPNADKDLKIEARTNRETWRRTCALEVLLRRAAPGNDSFCWRTAVLDRSAEVRLAAARMSASRGDPGKIVDYLAPGLMHRDPEIRVRTGEAMGEIGDRSAIEHLVLAGPNAGLALAEADPAARGHVAFLEQQSFIADYDVEVAQASFIADPKIRTLQSGVVLDASITDIQIERVRIVRAWRSALHRISGIDPGPDPRSWATWYARLPPATGPSANGR
ncbi:MAG: hypothetical protein Fur0037_25100 [Planctomycetota bacterium]